MMQQRQPCGCVNELHNNGVIGRVSTCERHLKKQHGLDVGFDYYKSLSVFDSTNCLMLSSRRAEFVKHFGEPMVTDDERVLEIGCGVSAVAPLFIRQGWDYEGLEPASWPARAMSEMYDVVVHLQKLEDFAVSQRYDAVVMAHCLEHLPDPVAAMLKVRELCLPMATIYVILPHGPDDPCNPDHLWFFDENSLRKLLIDTGFTVCSLSLQDGNPRERYLYCEAVS